MLVVEEEDRTLVQEPKSSFWYVLSAIVAFIWVFAGIAAFVMSLVCFGSSGTMVQKIVGFLLSVFIGPFYFIYLYVSKDYCRKSKK